MNTSGYTLLLCTNGAAVGQPALDYGVWLAEQLELPVTLLGIVESSQYETEVKEMLLATETQLETAQVPYTTHVRVGRAREVICAETLPEQHLVVLGPMGRPRWKQILQGSAFRRMMPNLQAPFIYTSMAHQQLARILICTGALDYAISAECWALYLAQRMKASLTILHVAEAIHYHYPTAEEIGTHWEDFLNADIPQARHLRTLLERAENQEVAATLQVRHGTVVHEIIAAAQAESYDLVVMGSKHSSHSLRRQYLPDVTAEVMETLKVPVLVVRADQTCVLAERTVQEG